MRAEADSVYVHVDVPVHTPNMLQTTFLDWIPVTSALIPAPNGDYEYFVPSESTSCIRQLLVRRTCLARAYITVVVFLPGPCFIRFRRLLVLSGTLRDVLHNVASRPLQQRLMIDSGIFVSREIIHAPPNQTLGFSFETQNLCMYVHTYITP
ncbi:uncharacterized protein LOC117189066 [Drosophila miranda]|uniref:uncharacterized protein LOC117189066 n=1 Tax=Drosophila miranda TaxID=7229 RepID=UPI00143F5D77|nr:uncharacterized protein LOC117189066 [Drosophila miranda]